MEIGLADDVNAFRPFPLFIPIDVAMNVGEQLQATGHVSRGKLGVGVQGVDQALAESFVQQARLALRMSEAHSRELERQIDALNQQLRESQQEVAFLLSKQDVNVFVRLHGARSSVRRL